MSDTPIYTPNQANQPHTLWKRGLWMLLLGMAFQVASMLLCVLAVAQFVLCLLKQDPNPRLRVFARSLGLYLRQIAEFVGFASEEIPFPFAEWPSGAPTEGTNSHAPE